MAETIRLRQKIRERLRLTGESQQKEQGFAHRNGEIAGPDQWRVPVPLNVVPSVPPFPVGVFPPALQRYCQDGLNQYKAGKGHDRQFF